MNSTNTTSRYKTTFIVMHWLMLLLLASVYACIELRELYPKGTDIREAFKTWHYVLGLSAFALVWLRLALRLSARTPPILPTPPTWQTLIAKGMHITLYILMIAMPIGGWLLLSGEGTPIPFFGLQLPALISENKEFAKLIKEIHSTAGEVGYYLIGLHAAAALFHHYVVRDNTLRRMLPGRD
jgi:cytochrome b561